MSFQIVCAAYKFLFIFRHMKCQGIPTKLIHLPFLIAMLNLEVTSWIQPMLIPVESQRKLLDLGWAGTSSSGLYPGICNWKFFSTCKSHWFWLCDCLFCKWIWLVLTSYLGFPYNVQIYLIFICVLISLLSFLSCLGLGVAVLWFLAKCLNNTS